MLSRILSVFLFCAGLFCLAQAQVPMTGAGLPKPGGFTPSCAASTNWLARATNVTLTADKTNYDNLLCGPLNAILANGVALYLFAAPDDTTALLNLLSSSNNGTKHGTESFAAHTGFTGDASTWYIDTGFAGGGNFTQNSASLGVCVLTSTASQNGTQIGTNDLVSSTITVQNGGTVLNTTINGGSATANETNSNAFWIGTRTASNAMAIYKNGSFQAASAAASTGVDDGNILMFARNNAAGAGVAVSFTNYQMAAAIIWGGLSSTDAATVSTAIHNYLTAYGLSGC